MLNEDNEVSINPIKNLENQSYIKYINIHTLLYPRDYKWQRADDWVGLEYENVGWQNDITLACRIIQKIQSITRIDLVISKI